MTANSGPNGVLIMEVSLYRTAYCGPSGVLIIEVSLYRTAYCGPSGVLIIRRSIVQDWLPLFPNGADVLGACSAWVKCYVLLQIRTHLVLGQPLLSMSVFASGEYVVPGSP